MNTIWMQTRQRSRRRLRIVSAIVAGVLVVLAVAACGGGTKTKSLTHSQLLSRLSSTCSTANLAAANLSNPGTSYSALAHYAKQLSPIVSKEISQLGGLKPDSADKPLLNRFVGALRTGNHGLALLATATTSAQATQAASVISSAPVTSVAKQLGVPACASSPDS